MWDAKPIKERVDLDLSSNVALRREYLDQVVVQIIEELKLIFFATDLVLGLEIDFDELSQELQCLALETEDSKAIIVLSLSSRLVEHDMFAVNMSCIKSGAKWDPLAETLVCFIERIVEPRCFISEEKSIVHLNEVATWINKKLCSQR